MPDQLLPQPPPDAPAPPASAQARRSQQKMDWLIRIGIYSIAGLLFWVTSPRLLVGHGKWPAEIEAVNNARQIGIGLTEFKKTYGKFPDSSTISEVKKRTGTPLTFTDNTSNDIFAQLLATGMVPTEQVFYIKAKSMRKPDNIWNSDSTVIARGECAFAYILGIPEHADPSTPVAFGPVIPGTRTLDVDACRNKAVVLKLDNSASMLPILIKTKSIRANGMDLLDPRQPFWRGKAPDVKWPK